MLTCIVNMQEGEGVYISGVPAMQEFDPWVKKMPWRRKWQPTPVILPGKFHGLRRLVGYSPWGCKESDTTEQFHMGLVVPWHEGSFQIRDQTCVSCIDGQILYH